VAVALALIAFVVLAPLSFVGFARVDSFERVGDGRSLVVQAIHDQGDIFLLSAVREEPAKVTVFVLRYVHPAFE
jgi:lipase chaperone LimK